MVFKEICIAIKNLPFFLQVLLLQSLKNVNTMEREGETKAHTHQNSVWSHLDPLEPLNSLSSTNKPSSARETSKHRANTLRQPCVSTSAQKLLNSQRNKASTFFADAWEVSPLKKWHALIPSSHWECVFYSGSWGSERERERERERDREKYTLTWCTYFITEMTDGFPVGSIIDSLGLRCKQRIRGLPCKQILV